MFELKYKTIMIFIFFLLQTIEAIGALDMIYKLQEHENKEVYEQALYLLDTYVNDVSLICNVSYLRTLQF